MANRRERRKAQIEAHRRGERTNPLANTQWWRGTLVWAIVGAIALGIVAFLLLQPQPAPPDKDASPSLPGVFFPSQGNTHLKDGETFNAYNSDPPTSGPHDPQPVEWGVSNKPQPKERLVHNMEHAGVVVWYNCQSCDDIINKLKAITEEYRAKGKLIVMVPYPTMDAKIAVTSWTRMLKMDQINEAAIRQFIEVHERRYNPEGF